VAISTPSDLEDALDESFGWRRVELQAMDAAIADAEKGGAGTPLSRALARSGIALLYAHWEGFVKDGCQRYVDYVSKRRLTCDQVNDGFLRPTVVGLARKVVLARLQHSGQRTL